jgi:hypothetical protein
MKVDKLPTLETVQKITDFRSMDVISSSFKHGDKTWDATFQHGQRFSCGESLDSLHFLHITLQSDCEEPINDLVRKLNGFKREGGQVVFKSEDAFLRALPKCKGLSTSALGWLHAQGENVTISVDYNTVAHRAVIMFVKKGVELELFFFKESDE